MSNPCTPFAPSNCSMTPPPPMRELIDMCSRGCYTPGMSKKEKEIEMYLRSPCDSGCWTPGPEEEDEEEVTEETLTVAVADAIAEILLSSTSESGTSSVFDSVGLTADLSDYIRRIAYYSKLTIAPFIGAVMLIDRLDSQHSNIITHKSIHRLFLAAVSIAHKALEEYQLTNTTIAAIGDITMDELKACEVELVTLLDWELGFSDENLYKYMELIVGAAGVSMDLVGNIGFLGY
eukprot:TRINITY_DN4652_c1_g1_i1.p1 TRINITY_DN4652_c1_g1~~TRINITY_DN4652_c1_g1_i1.p1  ORF type:complete len:234 (+),score=57.06 TRINITY_DN4652_c1_g1_i1:78-779(+)